mgnify:CR=1 FL=1
MSLAISFYNSHGIVMSADRRITTTINKTAATKESFLLTDTEQKLFRLSEQCGLSVTGSFSFNGLPVSSIINSYIFNHDVEKETPSQYLLYLAEYIKNLHNSDSDNCILILSGYRNTIPFVFSCGTSKLSVCNHIEEGSKHAVVYSGESDLLGILLNSKGFSYDYSKFTLCDVINFSRFMTKTVAGLQRYQQRIQTVSDDCDILCFTPHKSLWIDHLTLQ